MIKVKSIGYQADNVQVTVEYDLEDKTHSFTVGAKLRQVYAMSDEDIRDYIRGRVESERVSRLRALVESKLNALVDVDLEVTE